MASLPVLSTVFKEMHMNLAAFKHSPTVLDAFVFLVWVKLSFGADTIARCPFGGIS